MQEDHKEVKMYKKILVPLDGSDLAECVLPYVESIAKGCVVEEVVFIRVVESLQQISLPFPLMGALV
jgi:nucleotide-binding universal stress UspA family protein